MSTNDEAVRSTNDDAASCKRSAVELGYWSDPYIQFLTKTGDRKPPEISRGYYARVSGIRGLVRQFIKVGVNCIYLPSQFLKHELGCYLHISHLV
jgi:[phosphatase 2A protein]-leucine-carboxy methyltransferase